MTRDELIKLLKDNLKPRSEVDFLLLGETKDGRFVHAFLNVRDVCMNVDVDDPDNYNRGGIVFGIQTDLTKGG